MTIPSPAALHDLPEVVVGDLVFRVAPPRQRKTIEIVIERDASLTLKAPPAVTIERVTRFVNAKRPWVYRKLVEKDALSGPPVVKRFVEGEGFAYLGRSYRLTLTAEGTRVRLDRGRLHLPAAEVDQGAEAMRHWYTEVGTKWLQKRIRPWAARLGEESVTVEVRDLGFRWGSARPQPGLQRINVHWATLQLPPSLIDYVLVHELAHLRQANHTPEFWSIVERLIPGYQALKNALAVVGRNIWLGAAIDRAEGGTDNHLVEAFHFGRVGCQTRGYDPGPGARGNAAAGFGPQPGATQLAAGRIRAGAQLPASCQCADRSLPPR